MFHSTFCCVSLIITNLNIIDLKSVFSLQSSLPSPHQFTLSLQNVAFLVSNKNGNYINLWFTFTQMLNEEKVNKKTGYKLIYNSAKLSGRGERY